MLQKILDPTELPEGWGCFARPDIADYLSLAWRPLEWDAGDRNYSIATSHKGIVIGETYLNEIPESIVGAAWATMLALRDGDESVMSQVTHTRQRRGRTWVAVPLQRTAAHV